MAEQVLKLVAAVQIVIVWIVEVLLIAVLVLELWRASIDLIYLQQDRTALWVA